MKSKYLLFLFTFSFLAACENDQTVRFKFTNLDLNPTTSSSGMPQDCGDSVTAATFGIRLYLFPQEISRHGRYFDPNESGVINENPITKITVTSSDSFNLEPPGAILNHYFIHFTGNYLYTETLETSGTIHPTARYHDNYEEVNYPSYTDLLLRHDTPFFGSNKFYIRLDMYNGGYFLDSTQTIHLY